MPQRLFVAPQCPVATCCCMCVLEWAVMGGDTLSWMANLKCSRPCWRGEAATQPPPQACQLTSMPAEQTLLHAQLLRLRPLQPCTWCHTSGRCATPSPAVVAPQHARQRRSTWQSARLPTAVSGQPPPSCPDVLHISACMCRGCGHVGLELAGHQRLQRRHASLALKRSQRLQQQCMQTGCCSAPWHMR